MGKTWRFAGVNFSHMHMGDLLQHVADDPRAELVAICDENRDAMRAVEASLGLDSQKAFTDYRKCLEQTRPDVVVLCPPPAEHALWVDRVAALGVHLFVEKPFAASLADADRMIAAAAQSGKMLMINWPLRWVASHVTTHRLIREGRIGDVLEVHYYDGNRGPLYHGAGKAELQPTAEQKKSSWWYSPAAGGGSLRDYLGYGVTLATWFNGGKIPVEVTTVVDEPPGLEVDEHSITIVKYRDGLSKFETRWGTLSDPWTHQPLPKCGFVVRGTRGAIASYDYDATVRLQTCDCPAGVDHPVDELPAGERHGIEYMITRLDAGLDPEGPLSPMTARIGQQIVDAALRSAHERRTVPLEN
ncbi:MAG: Gfo/Idh/MocA family oxidoreductase [Planctomycetales bacterium]|nr:Gfo/Idh/MocA family oxidoreductase [Planctomycetales bacterium]